MDGLYFLNFAKTDSMGVVAVVAVAVAVVAVAVVAVAVVAVAVAAVVFRMSMYSRLQPFSTTYLRATGSKYLNCTDRLSQ